MQAEALVDVIQTNLMKLYNASMNICPPVGLEATRAYSMTGTANYALNDWACVEGMWRKYVCFMNYQYVLLG